MEKRIKDLEDLLSRFQDKLSAMEFKLIELAGYIKKPTKKKKEEKSLGTEIYDAYKAKFQEKVGVAPVRNAKVNRQCADLATRLGVEGIGVVEFYFTLKDPNIIRMNFPLGWLLMNCESVHASWKKGRHLTALEANKASQVSGNVDASKSYLERKHGNR